MSRSPKEPSFDARRAQARDDINQLDASIVRQDSDRKGFFNSVYDLAQGDAARVPWADLAPKPELQNWLNDRPGEGKSAIDIACGLGDNAEAIAQSGYKTIGFDISNDAVLWAKERFPQTDVSYQVADLFNPPISWKGCFDLVNECYTLQALAPKMLNNTAKAIADLVKPGGTLLIYSRLNVTGREADGPPWPLTSTQANQFAGLGFERIHEKKFEIIRPDKTIPHLFVEWRKVGL